MYTAQAAVIVFTSVMHTLMIAVLIDVTLLMCVVKFVYVM